MGKKYVALARVSSREQEREGFSLDVQEDALRNYATRCDGEIVKFYKIAETASKQAERKTFKELLAYIKSNADKLDGALFYKVDRAARNLFDYVELERLEADYNVRVIYVAQPTENTPAGRMQRRMLANMASFYTEQQSIDVQEGHERRVNSGLFVGKAPYGYINTRIDGRSIVETDPDKVRIVRHIFELYAYHNHTLDSLLDYLVKKGFNYSKTCVRFTRSKLHSILRDRAYIGEVMYRGQWHQGTQEAIIDRETFNRVQVLLGNKTHNAHSSVYGSGMITCGHCGHPLVVEVKTKQTKTGPKEYYYYRCARYNTQDHPKIRLTESQIDEQVLSMFSALKVTDQQIKDWMLKVLYSMTKETQKANVELLADIQRQLSSVETQKDRLLNLRLLDEIDADTFASKQTELRDRKADLLLQLEANSRQRDEHANLAVKVFELSQALENKWLNADITEKRQILKIVCLNLTLSNVTLCPTMNKPFDILAKGLISKDNRGDRI